MIGSLEHGTERIEATRFDPPQARRSVLFAVGAGGNPERHLPLLQKLSEHGCRVIAPHFERIVSPSPGEAELVARAQKLQLALDALAQDGRPVVGVGHSIGAMLLLALAGGKAWTRNRQQLSIARDARLDRLALLAPATLFFNAPGALDEMNAPLLICAGTRDEITPLAQAEFLQKACADRLPVELRRFEGAGHFSFMDVLPPHVTDPLSQRDVFLAQLAELVCAFATAA